MCECKVYKMRIGMECQCLTEDTERWVCVPGVQDGEGEAGKDSIPEKVALMVIKLFISYSAAYFVSLWAIPAAYNERGYEAYGGEYLLILAAFVTAYKATSLFFKNFRRKKRGKEGSRGTAWDAGFR